MKWLPDISFRVRLLVALVGSVGLLGFAGLLVIHYQTERQVASVVQRTAERTQRALAEVERQRRTDLERIAMRVTGSNRIAAALDSAVNDGDADAFVEQVQYELALAELEEGLVRFNDNAGHPVITLLDGARVADQSEDDLFAKVMASEGVVATGYRLFLDRLFVVQSHRLTLFSETIGTLTLGFAVDDSVAARLSAILESEVCFVAGDRCVAATASLRSGGMTAPILDAARASEPIFTTLGGRRTALVANALPGAGRIATVIAVPLDEVLGPFDRIQRVEAIAAAAALLLAVLLGSVLSKGLTTPIRTLVAATERVRRGDYNFSVQVPHRDEIGTLAGAFNQMTEGLLLKERYRGVLDKVVSPTVMEELLKGDLRLGGETRVVTTLFADVRGFTALSEQLPPEQVISMLNEWLELAAGVIEDEGGVVDKYVGDQVMAIFGAPLADDDHAARAVRAGVRLRDVTADLDRARRLRGDQPFTIGIGINTGPAVAGNSGSSKRLNYTVLGASVNAASRLCSEAGAGELLVGEQTYVHVADHVVATKRPPQMLKGFSHPTTSYLVHGFRETPREQPASAGPSAALLVVLGLLLAATGRVDAQVFDLPTLSELGVRYVSPGGLVQVRPSLRIDLDGYIPQDEPAWHLDETRSFVAGRGSLFVDLFVGRRLFVSTELRIDRGQPARAGSLEGHVQQAFVRVTPVPGRNFVLQVGKSISPFGSYPGRAHTASDPFIRPPLAYDYRTVISPDFVQSASDGIFTWKDRPQFRSAGLPIVWGVPYPIVATAGGGRGRWAFVAGVTTTAPSAEPEDWERVDVNTPAGLSGVGHVSYQIVPELQVGGSYTRGPYMRPQVADQFGPVNLTRQVQEAYGLDAAFARGHVEVRGEVLFNRWEVSLAAADPRDVSYYVDTRVTLAPGLFAAARFNAIHFRDLARSTGGVDRWDYNVRRWQVGSGYRLGRNTEIRGEYMINTTLGRVDPQDNLLSLQWWWTF